MKSNRTWIFLTIALAPIAASGDSRIRAVRPPAVHSSAELIDAAKAAGRIDSETALIFKVFAAFGDCRLPSEFVGNAGPLPDSNVIRDVRAVYSRLSAAAKSTLQPFLLAPGVHGSWIELETNCVNQRLGKIGVQVTPTVEWTVLESQNGKATVRYQTRFPEDAPRAEVIRQAVDAIWTPLTGYFQKVPLDDVGTPLGDGGDKRLDVWLGPVEERGHSADYSGQFVPAECSESPGYISINTAIPDARDDDRVRIAHELSHAITSVYKGDSCGDYRWLDEATATWAEHFLYPALFDRLGAEQFLQDPSVPLETTNGIHEYGAYLLLLYLELGLPQPSLIRLIWEGAAEPDSLVDIDAVLRAEQWGGLKKVWPQFARYAWNQVPVDDFHRWDALPSPFALTAAETRGQRVISDDKTTEKTLTRVTPLRHLSAQYHRLTLFDPEGRSVLFLNGWNFEADKNLVALAQAQALAYTSVPLQQPAETIRVETLVKINGQWQKNVGSSDWTNTPFKAWCRDLSGERLEEIVVIVSNSEFHDRNSMYTPAKQPVILFESNCACAEWRGSSKMTYGWVSGDALMTQSSDDLKWKRTTDEVGRVPFNSGFGLTGWSYVADGKIDWNAKGSYPLIPPDRCTLSGSGSFDAADISTMATFNFLPSGSELSGRYLGIANGSALPTFNVSCPGIPVATSTLGPWFIALTDSGDFPRVSDDGKILKGSRSYENQINRLTYSWNFVASPPQ